MFSETIKTIVIRNTWNYYSDDFDWIKDNTPENSVFLVPFGDCYGYNFDRFCYASYSEPPYVDSAEGIEKYNIDYIWVNQYIDFYAISAYQPDFLNTIKKNTLIYSNEKTKTQVYKVTT